MENRTQELSPDEKKYINEIIECIKFISSNDIILEQFNLITDRICFLLQKLHKNILCISGCNLCCREYGLPVLYNVEWDFLKKGLAELTEEKREIIKLKLQNIDKNIISENGELLKNKVKPETNTECPLLIEGKCSVYTYRPFKCRSHGYFFSYVKENPGQIKPKYTFVPATCSMEKERWENEVNFKDERYQSIPVQSRLLPLIERLNGKPENPKLLLYYLLNHVF